MFLWWQLYHIFLLQNCFQLLLFIAYCAQSQVFICWLFLCLLSSFPATGRIENTACTSDPTNSQLAKKDEVNAMYSGFPTARTEILKVISICLSGWILAELRMEYMRINNTSSLRYLFSFPVWSGRWIFYLFTPRTLPMEVLEWANKKVTLPPIISKTHELEVSFTFIF